MLETRNICYGYKAGTPVISNLSAEFAEGRIYGLLGLNGAGKTTLLKLLYGMIFPSCGSILMDGCRVGDRRRDTLCDIFLMPDEFRFTKMSLEKFIRLHSVFYPGFSQAILEDCLREFGMEKEIPDMSALSFGQKRKLMGSIALSFRTKVLMMDEPLNGMDIPSRGIFRKLILRHLGDEQTLIFSAHELSGMENIFSDIAILKNDGTAFISSADSLCARYSFTTEADGEDALYAEPCAGGYRTVREKTGDGYETAIAYDLLLAAVIKGAII